MAPGQPLPVDWNEVWKERMSRHVASNQGVDSVGFWQNREAAEKYWHGAAEPGPEQERIRKTICELPVRKDSRVLDIGAGPGVLALPLSRQVAHVTAVEPSSAMMTVLREQGEALGVQNVSPVEKRWEEVVVGSDFEAPYDVVVCSMSLGMMEIRDAIRKMEQACSGTVCLYWFAGIPSWDAHPLNLWPLLHGDAYHPGPKCDVLFNVLYQMGIYPHVSPFEFQKQTRFASLDDASGYMGSKYGVRSARQQRVVRDYLEGVLEPVDRGLMLRHRAVCMRICWEKQSH